LLVTLEEADTARPVPRARAVHGFFWHQPPSSS